MNVFRLNTLMQGIWSCLLHKYTGKDDITYGVVVSGRPDDLHGVEKRVGMYINTLPLRSELNETKVTVEWLQGLQAALVNCCNISCLHSDQILRSLSTGSDEIRRIWAFSHRHPDCSMSWHGGME